MIEKGQRFDGIYGLRHLAEDPWAAKEHPKLIGLTTILLAGYIEATTIPHLVNSNSNYQCFVYCLYILMSIQVIRLVYF